MKTKKYIAVLLAGLLCAACSEEEIPVYSGENYLYFTLLGKELVDVQTASVYVNFGYTTTATTVTQNIEVSLLGNMLTEDLTYRVSVVEDETTAVRGVHYDIASDNIFSKGKVTDNLTITAYRDPELLTTDYKLTLQLEDGEEYKAGPKEFSKIRVSIVDELSDPGWWQTGKAVNLGAYYEIKYRLLLIFLGLESLPDIDNYTGIEFNNMVGEFRDWWEDKWTSGEYQYYVPGTSTPMYETIIKQ